MKYCGKGEWKPCNEKATNSEGRHGCFILQTQGSSAPRWALILIAAFAWLYLHQINHSLIVWNLFTRLSVAIYMMTKTSLYHLPSTSLNVNECDDCLIYTSWMPPQTGDIPHSLRVNDDPHEQPFSAFGLKDILNAERISSSWYSTVDPFKYPSDTSSITTLAPSLSITLAIEYKANT